MRKWPLLFLLISTQVFATPAKLEFIFLSTQETASLLDYIEKQNQNLLVYSSVAQNENYECLPMGDGCFHPQLGMVEDPIKVKETKSKEKPKDQDLKTINSLETNLVNCDDNYYFDIYCGKAREMNTKTGVEIWIDVSSSFRTIDYSKDPNYCQRRSFATKVLDNCPGNVVVSTFNTSRKDMGTLSDTCMHYGTNDEDRLIDWIKGSNAKYLLVVTDIDELSQKIRDFIEQEAATVKGAEVSRFTVKDLVEYAPQVIKSCKSL